MMFTVCLHMGEKGCEQGVEKEYDLEQGTLHHTTDFGNVVELQCVSRAPASFLPSLHSLPPPPRICVLCFMAQLIFIPGSAERKATDAMALTLPTDAMAQESQFHDK